MTGNAHEVCSCKLLTISFFFFFCPFKRNKNKNKYSFFYFYTVEITVCQLLLLVRFIRHQRSKNVTFLKKNYNEGRTIHALDKCQF